MVEAAKSTLEQADLVLYLHPANEGPPVYPVELAQ
jgi:hypothetical protein